MHVSFIQPSVGRKRDGLPYPAAWRMEPLSLAVLSALTPAEHERVLHDDRMEAIPYDAPTDLACISVETFTARRAYQIASEYRRRSVPVVLGGFHPTLIPDDADGEADAVIVGEAESCWKRVLADAAAGRLRQRYAPVARPDLRGLFPDRSIFGRRNYGPAALVETSRGCRFACEFCSISSFYGQSYAVRPIADVAEEVRALNRPVFFVDDNIGADAARLAELCEALIPLRAFWIGQISIRAARDRALLDLLRRSGCGGVLIGFESLDPLNLEAMGKSLNGTLAEYEQAVAGLRRHGIAVYATFVFGYDNDTRDSFDAVLAFARRQRFFFCAFNHLVPFPGTPLYARLEREGRLLYPQWWRDADCRFGDVVFRPARMDARELADLCRRYRSRFYSLPSVFERMLDRRANCSDLRKTAVFLSQNLRHRRETQRRQGLPLGFPA